jgi:hypothetical protein
LERQIGWGRCCKLQVNFKHREKNHWDSLILEWRRELSVNFTSNNKQLPTEVA